MSIKTFQNAIAKFSLPDYDWVDGDMVKVTRPISPLVFDGNRAGYDSPVAISGEREKSFVFLDYYDEFQRGWMIHPKLEALAEKHGGFLEWCNPGCVAFYEN